MQFRIGAETLKSHFRANKVGLCLITLNNLFKLQTFCIYKHLLLPTAIDWGGVRREFIEIICAALFEPVEGGLFCTFHEKRQALVHPNPNRSSHLKLKYYEFAGKIVGKCLYGMSPT
jgi:hypothetical protein